MRLSEPERLQTNSSWRTADASHEHQIGRCPAGGADSVLGLEMSARQRTNQSLVCSHLGGVALAVFCGSDGVPQLVAAAAQAGGVAPHRRVVCACGSGQNPCNPMTRALAEVGMLFCKHILPCLGAPHRVGAVQGLVQGSVQKRGCGKSVRPRSPAVHAAGM